MFVRQNHKPRKQRSFPAGPRQTRRMGMSVKCMIFYDGDILLLQKKDREGLRPWEFPGGGLEFGEDYMMRRYEKFVKKPVLRSNCWM